MISKKPSDPSTSQYELQSNFKQKMEPNQLTISKILSFISKRKQKQPGGQKLPGHYPYGAGMDQRAINLSHNYWLWGGLANGQVGCQPGDGVVSLFAPIAVSFQANGMKNQHHSCMAIGVELAGLSCKGCCCGLLTRLA